MNTTRAREIPMPRTRKIVLVIIAAALLIGVAWFIGEKYYYTLLGSLGAIGFAAISFAAVYLEQRGIPAMIKIERPGVATLKTIVIGIVGFVLMTIPGFSDMHVHVMEHVWPLFLGGALSFFATSLFLLQLPDVPKQRHPLELPETHSR